MKPYTAIEYAVHTAMIKNAFVLSGIAEKTHDGKLVVKKEYMVESMTFEQMNEFLNNPIRDLAPKP